MQVQSARSLSSRLPGGLVAKMVTPLVILLVALVGAGGFTLVLISTLERTGEQQSAATSYLLQLENAAVALKAIANDERGYLIGGDEKYVTEVKERRVVADKAIAQAGALAPSDGATAGLSTLTNQIGAWHTALDAEFALYPSNRKAAIDAGLGANRDLRKTYEGTLKKLIDDGTAHVVAVSDLATLASRARLIVRAPTLVCALLAGAAAVAVARDIRRKTAHLMSDLDALSAGDLRPRETIEGRDELVVVSQRLGGVVTTLRGTIGALGECSRDLGTQSTQLVGRHDRRQRVGCGPRGRRGVELGDRRGPQRRDRRRGRRGDDGLDSPDRRQRTGGPSRRRRGGRRRAEHRGLGRATRCLLGRDR